MGFPTARIGRLAIQFGVTFFLLMAVVGVGLYVVAREQLVADVDLSLARQGDRLLNGTAANAISLHILRQRIATAEAARTVSDKGHAVFDGTDRQIVGHIRLDRPRATYSDVTFLDGPSSRPRAGRALLIPLREGAALVIVSHSEIVEDLQQVLLPLALALSFAAVLGGLLTTYLLARQIASRLERTMMTADAIGGDPNLDPCLHQRVPIDQLDGIFRQQALSFNRMLDRIAALITSQRQFSSNLAHDLRTPLTRLRGILCEEDRETLPPHVARVYERAERECASTIRIFDALLRLSEIEAGHHPSAWTRLSLASIIDDVAETMEPVLADAGCTLVIGDRADVMVMADADLLVQLLVNTLENVVLHTPPGTTARIDLVQEGEQATIRLSDDGPGLPSDQLQQVLQPFARRPATPVVRGSGLGLTIAHAIANFHGGDLRLSNAAPGLTVEVWLPLAAAVSV